MPETNALADELLGDIGITIYLNLVELAVPHSQGRNQVASKVETHYFGKEIKSNQPVFLIPAAIPLIVSSAPLNNSLRL